MKKRLSIYHILIALLIFSLFSPLATVFASQTIGDGDGEAVTGSLTIVKLTQDPKEEGFGERGDGDGNPLDIENLVGEPQEGVSYTITQTHSYDPSTDEWAEVNDGKTYEGTTDGDGKIVIDPIDLGRYEMQETGGPDHIVRDNRTYTIDVPMTSQDGSEINYDVHVYPKNELIRGSVSLLKVDGDSSCPEPGPIPSSDTGEEECVLLSAAEFDLYKEGQTDPIETGLVTGDSGILTVENLTYGKYYFKEVAAPEGYLINGEKVWFEIKEQDEVVEVKLDNYVKPGVEKEVDESHVNRGEEVVFTITVDLPSNIKSYESFVIRDVLHEHLEYVEGSQSNPAGFDFAKDGQTLTWTASDFDQIEAGTLEISFTAKVSEEAVANEAIENKASIEYDNRYEAGGETTPPVTVTPTAGSLTVKKIDGDSGEALAGAEFELRDASDQVVASGRSNSEGLVDFGGGTDELDYGSYTLVETKAPEGYSLLQKALEIEINEDHTKLELEVKNYQSDWELPKTGGIGTTLFTALGTLLMAAAVYLYTRRRKQSA